MSRAARGLLALTALLLGLGAAARSWDVADVAAYYDRVTGGVVVQAPATGHRQERFVLQDVPLPTLESDPPRDPVLDHDLMMLDVPAFLERTGAPDLQTARWRVYAGLPWLDGLQAHDRPYAYLEGWNDLFHPPIIALVHPRSVYWADLAGPRPDREGQPWFDPAFQDSLDEATGSELTAGNHLELLPSGESFHEKLRLVRSAQETLYVAVMFFACDRTSNMLADAMIERVRAGVDVRFVTEALYRQTLERRCVDRLEQGGVKVVSVAASGRWETLTAVMHQKIWIADGREMILGGQNILDFENLATGFNLMDRDIDVLVAGPTVTDAMRSFHDTWDGWSHDRIPAADREAVALRLAQERQAGLRGSDQYADWLGNPAQRTTGLCRLAMQDLMAETHAITPIVEAYLRASRDLVVFSAPTLTLDMDDPRNAHLVDTPIGRVMRLIQHGSGPDSPHLAIASNGRGGGAGELSTWLHRRYLWYRQAGMPRIGRIFGQYHEAIGLRASARNRPLSFKIQQTHPSAEVWWYFQYLHSKLWLFDRTVVKVSSYNLDVNSAHLNSENAIFCMDDRLVEQVEDEMVSVFVNSIPVVGLGEDVRRREP